MKRWSRGWAVSLAVCLSGVGPGGGQTGGEAPDFRLEIPRPNLSALQPAARHKIETLQGSLEAILAAGDVEAVELREGFGFLGQLFHAFELLEAAEICYRSAASLAPRDPRWAYYLGLAANSRGDLDRAVRQYELALELGADRQATLIRLGNALLEQGLAEEAGERFEQVLESAPESAAAIFGLGRVEALRGRPQRAIDHFNKALALQPEASAGHYPLAQAYRAVGDREKATEHLALRGDRPVSFPDRLGSALVSIAKSTALEVVADLAAQTEGFSAASFLGFVLSQFERVPGAEDQLVAMLEQLDESPAGTELQRARVAYAIGGLMVGRGRDLEAVPYFERAVGGDPGLRDAWIKLGNLLARQGRFEESLASYDRALAMEGADPSVLAKRATALVNLERLQEAHIAAQRAVDIDPGTAAGWRLLGEIQERLGAVDAAVGSFEQAVAATTEPEEKMAVHLALGDLYRRRQQSESAAREYLKALKIDEDHVPALDRLASLLGQLGYYLQASEVYRRWTEREPDNAAARVGEATFLIFAEEHETARQRLEEGLAVLPESLDLMDVLARHLAACPDPEVRDGTRAVELARELFQAVPSLESMETLAMALAEDGQFEEAVAWQERLLKEAGQETDTTTFARWRANLELYQKRQPCCAGASG